MGAKKLPVRERLIAQARRKIKSRSKRLAELKAEHAEDERAIQDEIDDAREVLRAFKAPEKEPA